MATATKNRIFTAVLTAAAVLLPACNGPTDVAGIQGSGSPSPAATTVGPITGFGSIFVDGVDGKPPPLRRSEVRQQRYQIDDGAVWPATSL
jgi:hypothetical protein